MFIDIGLGDWYVPDINRATGEGIARMLMGILSDAPGPGDARQGDGVRDRTSPRRDVRRTLGLPAAGTPG